MTIYKIIRPAYLQELVASATIVAVACIITGFFAVPRPTAAPDITAKQYPAFRQQIAQLVATHPTFVITMPGNTTPVTSYDLQHTPTADHLEARLSALLNPVIARASSQPLIVTADAAAMTLSPHDIHQLITPVLSGSGNDYAVGLTVNTTGLKKHMDNFIAQATVPAHPAISRDGSIVNPGKPGLQIKDPQPIHRIANAIAARTIPNSTFARTLALPMARVQPPVHDLATGPTFTTGTHRVRLTFDDGPGAHTAQLLAILRRYNVHATFYVIGQNVAHHPVIARQICHENHTLANHTYDHAPLTHLMAPQAAAQIATTQSMITQLCGTATAAFRPPYGMIDQNVLQIAHDNGVSVDMWSVDPQDWTQPGVDAIVQQTIAHAQPGSVILLHDLYPQTVAALPGIIEGLRQRGLELE